MRAFIAVFLGGGLGSGARYLLAEWVATLGETKFPWGTLAVNVLGCFLIGLFSMLTAPEGRWPAHPELRQFFTVGVLGGFTTFSAFSWHTLQLARDGDPGLSVMNVVGSLVLCLVAVALGFAAAVAVNRL